MKYKLITLIAALLIFPLNAAKADTLIESYVAFLSNSDHFNSKGQRLTDAAAIIRQDRANFHKLGHRDAGDEADSYFSKASNRELLERLINRGTSTRSAINAIVNGTPYVIVNIYRSNSGSHYVNVTVTN